MNWKWNLLNDDKENENRNFEMKKKREREGGKERALTVMRTGPIWQWHNYLNSKAGFARYVYITREICIPLLTFPFLV